jgi:hypothetical protein
MAPEDPNALLAALKEERLRRIERRQDEADQRQQETDIELARTKTELLAVSKGFDKLSNQVYAVAGGIVLLAAGAIFALKDAVTG